MRIKENFHEGDVFYSRALHDHVVAVFNYASQIREIKRLLAEIKKDAVALRLLFWTEEELKERRKTLSFFDARMQAAVYYTLRNIEGYQQYGWRQLIYEGEDSNERVESIQEKK